MIAALPMYDRPETAAANDAFWAAIRAELGDGPEELTREGDLWEIWQSPELLLAQTCSLPFRARLHPAVTLVATPDYGLPGCAPGFYNSVLVVHPNSDADHISGFEGKRLAYNEPLSQSGWAAPMGYAAGFDVMFGAFVQTGAHLASARAVAEGRADIAAIDALTWEMIRRYDPFAAELRELDRTTPTPALPYIAARGHDPARIAEALEKAITALGASHRDTLGLRGIVRLPAEAYLALPIPAPPPENG
ncbi:PhnD/SsuA/transferrin family substrate-binding protein [Primorskyibacter aestuariivivens]|uniref:phosphate/phosphite/phosphonate ABC transporter substrate-binding protein n=1 Tax=Primorskyibacter aestuariivivens TaxID=1888912 RepID=UPI0023011031|nr:PhnD/SsuA/transferrin family substrate-binding protein [Primorskyibacter aestuariivivens]MDA7427097.1 PhnD/SsuA/transferrin family substrate-binding protein [Primorskyibacter aestuariivivens]